MFPKIMVPHKSSILIGFSIINHPFWGSPILGNTHLTIGGATPGSAPTTLTKTARGAQVAKRKPKTPPERCPRKVPDVNSDLLPLNFFEDSPKKELESSSNLSTFMFENVGF